MTWARGEFGQYVLGNAEIFDNGAGLGPAAGSGRWALEVDGNWVENVDTLAAAQAKAETLLTRPIDVEGCSHVPGDKDAPFMLGLFLRGEIQNPGEIVPGYPTWFTAPRFAKAAGHDLLARVPDAAGFDIVKVDRGHYRTVATEYRS